MEPTRIASAKAETAAGWAARPFRVEPSRCLGVAVMLVPGPARPT